MQSDRALSLVSAAQLSLGVAGLAVALRRKHAYDFLMLHGRPEKVGRDALTMGTALSAPASMLIAQTVAIARLHRGPSRRARITLGTLGAVMITGYLGESLGRRRLRPSQWDPVESPIVAAGLASAAAMAVIAFSSEK
jgi:hypothetical protein